MSQEWIYIGLPGTENMLVAKNDSLHRKSLVEVFRKGRDDKTSRSLKLELLLIYSIPATHFCPASNVILILRTRGRSYVSIQTERPKVRSWYKPSVTRCKMIRTSSVTWLLDPSRGEELINVGQWVSWRWEMIKMQKMAKVKLRSCVTHDMGQWSPFVGIH